MRLLHRLSSVAFGTALGRLLVLFLILPFGLAFFTLITPGIAVEEGEKLLQLIGLMAEAGGARQGTMTNTRFPIPNLWGVAGLGVFFLLLFHVASFRSRVLYGVGQVGQGLQAMFVRGILRVHQFADAAGDSAQPLLAEIPALRHLADADGDQRRADCRG